MSVATAVLLLVLLIAACAACGALIWLSVEGVQTARSVRRLSDDMDVRLVPLLDKADVTVDALNAELLRVDGIVTQVEDATGRASDAAGTVRDVVNAPVELVSEIGVRLGRLFTRRD